MSHPTALITIVHGRRRHLERQHDSLGSGVLPDHYVVVAMDDAGLEEWAPQGLPTPHVVHVPSDPRGLPLAAARNAGVRTAQGLGAEVLIGVDVDCMVGAETVAAYRDAVRDRPDVLWSGPTTYLSAGDQDCDPRDLGPLDDPHPARPAPDPGLRQLGAEPDLFWSLSFATSVQSWDAVGGFCEDYAGYGAEDTDFAHRWVASGRSLGWLGSARAYHQHHPTQHPPVQHLDDILRNGAIFAERWGRWPMVGWLTELEARGLVSQDSRGSWVKR